ncbi:MAG TPA: DUF2177 family protein [Rhizomicrobium sp.]
MKWIAAYAAALVTLLAMDAVWLSQTFATIYKPVLGPLQAAKTNWPAAAVFYLIYPVGILFFATFPALRSSGWASASFNGVVLGFFAYATYDLTNYATLRGWTLGITLADIGWGMVITGAAATASYIAASLTDRLA